MLRMVIVAALAVAAAGCDPTELRSYEGQACSVNSNEDPQRVCNRGEDLVCITTYSIEVTHPTERLKWDGGLRPVWLCRLACTPGEVCPQSGDVCCPGMIHGVTYNKTHACVPAQFCPRSPSQDAGRRDAAASGDAGVVDAPASGDGGGADGGAGDATDAAVDAATTGNAG